jgi:hypothetical protein
MNKDNLQNVLLEHIYYSSLIYECPDKFSKQNTINKKLGDIILDEEDKNKQPFKDFINEMSPSGEIIEYDSNSRDVQYGIIQNDKEMSITVVFRGSESMLDWYHDLIVFKKSIYGEKMKVHKGFHLQLFNEHLYYNIEQKLLNLKLRNPSYQLYVTGHSAGAALATLFAFFFANTLAYKKHFKLYDHTIVCISFASPRIGNKAFQKEFNEHEHVEHFRCFNTKDIISAVPNYKYYHTGYGVKISKKETFLFLDTKNKEQYHNTFIKFWKLSEHFSSSYCKRIKSNDIVIIK